MKDLNFNIFNIIIFSGIIQGLIFSAIVLTNKKYKSKTNNFIAYTVIVLSISNLQYWFMDVGFKGILNIFDSLRIPCDMLIVPAFYFYVNSYLGKNHKIKTRLLFCIPFLVSLIFNALYYYNLIFTKNEFRTINIALETFSLLFNLSLIIIVFIIIRNFEKKNTIYDRDRVVIKTKWLKQILIIGGVMCIFWTGEIIYMQSRYNGGGLTIYYPLWISISFLVYWISYMGIMNSKIHNERILIRSSFSTENLTKKSRVNDENIFGLIIEYIKNEKAYLNPNICISDLAQKFQKSNGYISQLISNNSKSNFSDIINSLRICEAKKMLSDKDFNNYTITAIGLESGFKTKSSFYNSFKKFENITPTEYKKSVQNS